MRIEVALQGRCARDAEGRYTPKGRAFLDVAVDAQNGRDVVEQVRVTRWGDSAFALADALPAGAGVYVEGWLNVRRFDDGTFRLEVAADLVEPLGIAGKHSREGRRRRSWADDQAVTS